MISKKNITRCAKTIKQLISRCESYGEFNKDGILHLPVEKTEYSSLKISKDKLNECESSGMSILELHQKLEGQTEDCEIRLSTHGFRNRGAREWESRSRSVSKTL